MSETAASVIDLIIESTPKAGQTFEIQVGSQTLTFRSYEDYDELARMQDEAPRFAEKMRNPKRCPESWREFHTPSQAALLLVYILPILSVEPKLTQLDVLKLAKLAPLALETIKQRVDRQGVEIQNREVEEIEEEKKDSETTPTSSTG